MRTLTDTLKKAQQVGFLNPLYKIVLTKGASTYTYDNDRILPSKHDEEMYSHRAEIVLHNRDHELDDIDLKGYDAVISYGFGSEYSATAPVSVIDQQFNSDPNNLTCTLFLEGIPNMMAEDEASEDYKPEDTDTKTVKTLVDAICGATLSPFTHCHAYEVVWDDGYDSLADSYQPKDGLRIYEKTSRLASLRKVLDYTANVPRFEDDGKIHILKPITTGTTYDSEYALGKGNHNFFSKAYRETLIFPNRFVVKSLPDDDPQYQGEAKVDGYDSLPDKVKKTRFVRVKLESNDQGTNVAEALLSKAEIGSARGQAIIRINVGSEIFDYVKVTDSRQGDTRTGNLGYIHRRFGGDKWEMTFGFGNWFTSIKTNELLKDLETYTDAGNYFSRLMVGDLHAEHILADNMDFVWIDPDNTIDLSKIGDNLDNLPDGETYARVKTLHLDAGIIKLDENILYSSGYDPTEKEKEIAKQDTAPESPSVGDLWLDTSVSPQALKEWDGAQWKSCNIANLDELPDGTTYQRVKSAALTAEGLVILDQVIVGTYGLVKSTDISAGHIKLSTCSGDLDDIADGYYGKVRSSDISAGHILLSECSGDLADIPGDLDDIGDGSTYGKIKATELSSGYIKLTSETIKDGEWYNEAGVEIDADNGINIYGQNNALTTRATKTGTIQCSVNSSGQIIAGAGNVVLDSDGITIKGQYLTFKYGAGTRGYVCGDSSAFIVGSIGVKLILASSTSIEFSPYLSGIDMSNGYYLILPQKTSAPSSPQDGMTVFNPNTGYTNIYHDGAWHHLNRDAGWA